MTTDNTNTLPAWIKEIPEGCQLTLRVTPGASRSEICGAETEWLKVRIKAPPVDGKANKELIRFLAKLLKIPKCSIEICSGGSSRLKRIKIKGITTKEFLTKFAFFAKIIM